MYQPEETVLPIQYYFLEDKMLINENQERKDHIHKFSTTSPYHKLLNNIDTFANDLDDGLSQINHTLIGKIGNSFEQLQMETILFIIENQFFMKSDS